MKITEIFNLPERTIFKEAGFDDVFVSEEYNPETDSLVEKVEIFYTHEANIPFLTAMASLGIRDILLTCRQFGENTNEFLVDRILDLIRPIKYLWTFRIMEEKLSKEAADKARSLFPIKIPEMQKEKTKIYKAWLKENEAKTPDFKIYEEIPEILSEDFSVVFFDNEIFVASKNS